MPSRSRRPNPRRTRTPGPSRRGPAGTADGPGRTAMGIELTGIVTPGGAKAKAELLEDAVVFRGDIKQEVGFEEITAEARGTLLVLSFRGKTVELSAGA